MCITSLFWRTNRPRDGQRDEKQWTGLYIHLMKWCMNGMLATDKEGDKESFHLSVTIRVHYISSSWSSHKRTQHWSSHHPFCATPKTTFIRRWRTNWRIYLLIPDSWRAINGMRRCCCWFWWVLCSSCATGNGWFLSGAIRSGPVLALLILTSRVKWSWVRTSFWFLSCAAGCSVPHLISFFGTPPLVCSSSECGCAILVFVSWWGIRSMATRWVCSARKGARTTIFL